MPAGYSGTTLLRKLGIKSGMRLLLENTPDHYERLIHPWPDHVEFSNSGEETQVDFIHYFTQNKSLLLMNFPILKKRLTKDGICWISWPKWKSKLSKNLNENDVREIGLLSGLVDVKVCAVDEDWSALKFVYRKKDR